MTKIIASIFLALFLAACNQESAAPQFYKDDTLPATIPLSSAVIVGDTVYLSGSIGIKPGERTIVEGGVGAETRQIFANYAATLANLDLDLSNIVKCTVFLEDMNDYGEMNTAYAEAFPGNKPARSALGVDGLALGAAVEIECLAVKS